MFLDCFQSEGGGLLFSLPLLAWKRHPFTNDCSARLVFRFHIEVFSRSSYVEACIPPGYGVIDCNLRRSALRQRWHSLNIK